MKYVLHRLNENKVVIQRHTVYLRIIVRKGLRYLKVMSYVQLWSHLR